MDLVGFEAAVLEYLAQYVAFIGNAEFLGDFAVERCRGYGEAGLRRADQQDIDAASLRQADHCPHVVRGLFLRQAAKEVVAAMA